MWFKILLFALLCTTVYAQFEGTTYTGPLYVHPGDAFELTCVTNAYRFPKWTRNGVDVSSDNDRIYVKQYNKTTPEGHFRLASSVRVLKAELSDTGRYRCDAFHDNSHLLTVMNPDSKEGVECHVIQPGMNLTLKCPEFRAPYKWFLGDQRYLPKKHVEIRHAMLIFHGVTEQDAGKYVCESIRDSSGLPERTFHIVTPIVIPDPPKRSEMHKLGFPAVLDCHVSSDPPPYIEWFIGKEPALLMKRLINRVHLSNSSTSSIPNTRLTISVLNKEDEKEYTCRASHTMCNIRTEQIIVLRASRNIVSADGETFDMSSGSRKGLVGEGRENVILRCKVPAGKMKLWLKDGVPVASGGGIALQDTQLPDRSSNMTLRLFRVRLSDSGRYQCYSEGPDYELIVDPRRLEIDPPIARRPPVHMTQTAPHGDTDIDTKDSIKYIERGHKMMLECHHKENTHSPVIWSKGGSDLSNDSVITISADTNTLIISRPEPHHAGNYTCKLGTQNATIQVFMNVSVASHETSKNQVEGDPLQITCDAIGYPTPEVNWYKDTELLTPDDRISFEDVNGVIRAKIVIKDLTFNDKGLYKCVATNAHSKGQMEITVRVKDKYAALWPFLGICAEVAILCTIICIYEKRRSKPEFEDESEDKADRKEGHDVRQRK